MVDTATMLREQIYNSLILEPPEAWVGFDGWRETVILSYPTRIPEEPAPAEERET